jgi:hypothetical protein
LGTGTEDAVLRESGVPVVAGGCVRDMLPPPGESGLRVLLPLLDADRLRSLSLLSLS